MTRDDRDTLITASELQATYDRWLFLDLEYIDQAEDFACYVITGIIDNDGRNNDGDPTQWDSLESVLDVYSRLGDYTLDYRSLPGWQDYERALEQWLIDRGNL